MNPSSIEVARFHSKSVGIFGPGRKAYLEVLPECIPMLDTGQNQDFHPLMKAFDVVLVQWSLLSSSWKARDACMRRMDETWLWQDLPAAFAVVVAITRGNGRLMSPKRTLETGRVICSRCFRTRSVP